MQKYGLALRVCALRWIANHNLLRKEKGIVMLVGGNSAEHLESNLVDMEKGPLPEEVLEALDKAWEGVKGVSWKYWLQLYISITERGLWERVRTIATRHMLE